MDKSLLIGVVVNIFGALGGFDHVDQHLVECRQVIAFEVEVPRSHDFREKDKIVATVFDEDFTEETTYIKLHASRAWGKNLDKRVERDRHLVPAIASQRHP